MTPDQIITNSISTLSLGVAITAYFHSRRTTKEQKKFAVHTLTLTGRGLVAQHHQKYSDLIFSIENQLTEPVRELSHNASSSMIKIGDLLDEADSHQMPTTYLRHLYYETCSLIYDAFHGQLGWQRGLNIHSRYLWFQTVEEKLLGYTAIEKKKPWWRFRKEPIIDFKKEYFKNPNKQLENSLYSYEPFLKKISALESRIPKNKKLFIFKETLKILEPYISEFNQLQPMIEKSIHELDNGLKQNDTEEFKLKESWALYDSYIKTQRKLEILNQFGLQTWKYQDLKWMPNSLSHLIYFGAILTSVNKFSYWGEY